MRTDEMTRASALEVRRDELADARVVDDPLGEPADGQALLRVERFGLTANVITYAVAGDTIGYWRFFPAGEDGWGRIPAWGFAEVVASACDALADGDRLFGYLPMATHVLLTPEARGSDVLDVTPHRAELPRAYNVYRRAGKPAEADARELVLRPLFLLCFLLADQLEAEDRSGAEQVLVSSASSKTALGLAHELGSSGARVTGLTSPGNLEFVRSTGVYDEVVSYADVGSLDAGIATVTVDMAGDGALRRAIHEHFGDSLRSSVLVGATHAGVASFAPDPASRGRRRRSSSSRTGCGSAPASGARRCSGRAWSGRSRTSARGRRDGWALSRWPGRTPHSTRTGACYEARCARTARSSRRSAPCALLEGDALEHVRDALASVDRLLERLEDVLPADHDHRVDAVREELRDGGAADLVGLVLEPVDLDQVPARSMPLRSSCSADVTSRAARDEQLRDRLGLLHRRLDAVAAELVGGLLGEVDDVVERDRERVHVGGVEVGAAALLGEPAAGSRG